MKCWHCNTELIWGGDHDIENEGTNFIIDVKSESYSMVTNLSCPNCGCHVEIYYPKEKEETDVI